MLPVCTRFVVKRIFRQTEEETVNLLQGAPLGKMYFGYRESDRDIPAAGSKICNLSGVHPILLTEESIEAKRASRSHRDAFCLNLEDT